MSLRVSKNAKLLFGPYEPPPLKKGDRETCLYRDAQVVVTSWSDGRISWPRCRALGHRGGSGLLIDDELARAVRSESAAAVMFWWGVGCNAVWSWRKALGVEGRDGIEGSRRLIRAAAESTMSPFLAREVHYVNYRFALAGDGARGGDIGSVGEWRPGWLGRAAGQEPAAPTTAEGH
jgi:hypothetical protein